MTRYLVQMINRYTKEVLETFDDDDQIFDSYEEAADYACKLELSGLLAAGEEQLDDMGIAPFVDPADVEFIVVEFES